MSEQVKVKINPCLFLDLIDGSSQKILLVAVRNIKDIFILIRLFIDNFFSPGIQRCKW